MIKPKKLNKGDKVAIVSLSRGLLGYDIYTSEWYGYENEIYSKYGILPYGLKATVDYDNKKITIDEPIFD